MPDESGRDVGMATPTSADADALAILEGIVESSPNGIVVFAPDGAVLRVNPRARTLLASGEGPAPARLDDHDPAWADLVNRALAGEVVRETLALSNAVTVEAQGAPVRRDGAVVGIYAILREMPPFEQRFRDASSLLAAMVESVPALIYVKDVDGRLLLANARVLEVVGKDLDAIRGLTDAQYLDDPEAAALIMGNDAAVLAAGVPREMEERLVHPVLGERIFLSRKAPLRDGAGALVGLVGTSIDITERTRAEAQRALVTSELDHRVKNLFAMIGAMISAVSRTSESPRAMAEDLRGRIEALATAHALVSPLEAGSPNRPTDPAALMSRVAAAHLADGRAMRLSGPTVPLSADGAAALALVAHELVTNAAKYGAFSRPDGVVTVDWAIDEEMLVVDWQESGGPPVTPPEATGFGSTLVERTVRSRLRGTLERDWAADGLKVRARLALAGLTG